MAQRQFRSDDTDTWSYKFGDGSDGAYSSSGNATDAPIDSSCSGTSGTTSLSATNASFTAGQLILIHQTRGTGSGNWELNRIESYTTGTITTSKNLINTYTDSGASQAQVLVMKQYTTFTQNSGHTLTAKAWDGNVGGIIAFLCNGTTTIDGTITSNYKGFLGGDPRTSGSANAYSGEGTGGTKNQQIGTANGNGASGSSVPTNTAGGGGGNGTAGSSGQGTPSDRQPGQTAGNAALTSMVFGGGGGGIVNNVSATAVAGNGGGIILIISKTITINSSTGLIKADGENGDNQVGGDYARSPGGGAGGSVLIKSTNATLGTNKITVAAGSAGVASGGTSGNLQGGAGGVGRIHLDYSVSYTGTTTPSIDVTNDLTITDAGVGPLFFSQI